MSQSTNFDHVAGSSGPIPKPNEKISPKETDVVTAKKAALVVNEQTFGSGGVRITKKD